MKKLLILLGCALMQMMELVFAQQQQIATLQNQFSQLTGIFEKMPKPKIPEKPAILPPAPTIAALPVEPAKLTKQDYVKYLDVKIAEIERSLTPGQGTEELAMLKGIREDLKTGISLQKAVAEEIPEAPAIIPDAPAIPTAPELPSGVPAAPPVPTMEKPSKKPVTTVVPQGKKAPTPRDAVMKEIQEGAFKLKKTGTTTPQTGVTAPQGGVKGKDALLEAIRGGVKLKRAQSVLPKKEEETGPMKELRERLKKRSQATMGEEEESNWETA